MKWLMFSVLIFLGLLSWGFFAKKGREMDKIQMEIQKIEEMGDPDEKLNGLRTDYSSVEGERMFSGILLTFVSSGIVGVFVVVYLLPFFAQRVTHAVYDSAEMVEKDVMHDARVKVAQGDYLAAIESYKEAAKADPLNRLPWVEIAKIYKDNLEDPQSAIDTIRYALESQEWEVNDAAYFLFRLAELYDEVLGDRDSAIAIMHQVVQQFPRTRHSANANTRLHEWGADQEAAQMDSVPHPVVPPMVEVTRYELPSPDDDGPGRVS